jgi:hypothetical protein
MFTTFVIRLVRRVIGRGTLHEVEEPCTQSASAPICSRGCPGLRRFPPTRRPNLFVRAASRRAERPGSRDGLATRAPMAKPDQFVLVLVASLCRGSCRTIGRWPRSASTSAPALTVGMPALARSQLDGPRPPRGRSPRGCQASVGDRRGRHLGEGDRSSASRGRGTQRRGLACRRSCNTEAVDRGSGCRRVVVVELHLHCFLGPSRTSRDRAGYRRRARPLGRLLG